MTDELPEPEPETRDYVATCHTDGCGNAGHAIPITTAATDEPPQVFCGVCSQPITDVTTE